MKTAYPRYCLKILDFKFKLWINKIWIYGFSYQSNNFAFQIKWLRNILTQIKSKESKFQKILRNKVVLNNKQQIIDIKLYFTLNLFQIH